MSELRPLPFRKIASALERLGFRPVRQRGSHVIFMHADGRVAVVPRHDREDIGRGFLRGILKDARIDLDEFLAAL
ncbi:MAG: type II toxin-antitoxin system HicA family toxin [Thermoplasmatota archaeon]